MKLLLFISSLQAGGAERVTANLANYMADRGWQVFLVTLAPIECDYYKCCSSVVRINIELTGSSKNIYEAIINNLKRVIELRRVLKMIRPDIALAMMTSTNVTLALSTIGLKRLVVLGSERCHPPAASIGFFWSLMRKYFYGYLSGVIALTNDSGCWLKTNTRAKKIIIIPNAVKFPLPNLRPNIPIPTHLKGQKILLAVGRLSKQKGFDILISVFHKLSKDFPEWTLVILGEGQDRKDLEQQIKLTKLAHSIFMPGLVGNIETWYKAASLFVMSSRFEGFPNALAEAMAYGLPVVSFNCETGPSELIRHEINGLLVSPEDVNRLEKELRRMMTDCLLRQKLASRATEIRDRFSIESVMQMWEKLFKEISLEKIEEKCFIN